MTAAGLVVTTEAGSRVVAPGASLTFGRTPSPGTEPPSGHHLGLADSPTLHAHAGTAVVDDDGWQLVNTGRWLSLRLRPTAGADRADVAPGRSLRVPWAEARVEIVTGDGTYGFDARCPALAVAAVAAPPAPPVSGDTVGGLGLDREAGYFLALVALCEPRLRDPASDEVASTAEIARRLNRASPGTERVTAKAVERRLAHVRTRVGVGQADPLGTSAAGLEVRDAAHRLVDLALRTGTVTADDLAALEP